MRDQRLKLGSEALDLGRPVGQQRRRRHQQARRRAAAPSALQHQQQRQHLDGLAQTHVVGQARAQSEAGQQVQPRTPAF